MKTLDLNYFQGNEYSTKNNSRFLIDKIFLNTRIYFVIKYALLVLKNRKLALHEKYDRKACSISSMDTLKLIEHCGGKFHIEGIDNVRNCKEPVVFVSNHMSALEVMVFPCLIAPFLEISFVIKKSLNKHFFMGPVVRARNPIAVGRLNSREDLISVMEQGKNLIEKGNSIIIFPQGGRREIFNPKEFNSLGVKLAKFTGSKVIPIALKTDFWGNGKLVRDLGPIRRKRDIFITFGKPVEIKGNGKMENEQIIKFIGNKLKEWKKN